MHGRVALIFALSLSEGLAFSATGQANQFAEHPVAPSAQYLIPGSNRAFTLDSIAQIEKVATGTRHNEASAAGNSDPRYR